LSYVALLTKAGVSIFTQLSRSFYVRAMATPLVLMIVFRDFVGNIVGGVVWRFKSNYEEESVIQLDGELGVIAHIGILQTKFYIYIVNDKGEVVGKWVRRVLNNHLRSAKVKVLAPNVEIPTTTRSIYR